MKYNEFEIISNFFNKHKKIDNNLIKGIGDNSTLVKIPKYNILSISTDDLVEDTHFFKNINPKNLVYKTIAINLSDLDDMSSLPQWIALSITMPKSDSKWVKSFSENFFKIFNQYNIMLIGGYTNYGSLSLTLSIYGLIKGGKSLLRKNPQKEDLIYITSNLREIAADFFLLQKKKYLINTKTRNYLIQKHLNPIPRVSEGIILRNFSNSSIDISDRFISDLGHILK